MNNEN
jgi:hypothetical protein